jgi:hypothetical protein
VVEETPRHMTFEEFEKRREERERVWLNARLALSTITNT